MNLKLHLLVEETKEEWEEDSLVEVQILMVIAAISPKLNR
jgi:hypothetical protein